MFSLSAGVREAWRYHRFHLFWGWKSFAWAFGPLPSHMLFKTAILPLWWLCRLYAVCKEYYITERLEYCHAILCSTELTRGRMACYLKPALYLEILRKPIFKMLYQFMLCPLGNKHDVSRRTVTTTIQRAPMPPVIKGWFRCSENYHDEWLQTQTLFFLQLCGPTYIKIRKVH